MKLKKTTLRNKCDKLIGAKVRARGYCEICGSKNNLSWVHYITRAVIKLRFHPRNTACICASCHFRGHDDPYWFTEQWNRIKGPGVTLWLSRESTKLQPITIKFYQDVLDKLKNEKGL